MGDLGGSTMYRIAEQTAVSGGSVERYLMP